MNKLKKANKEHQEWLIKKGIRRTTLKGVGFPDYTIGRKNIPETSNNMTYYARKNDPSMDTTYIEAVKEKANTVAPSFNKGPFQPQTNTDFTKSGRRS